MTQRLLDLLATPPTTLSTDRQEDSVVVAAQYERTREKMLAMLIAGELDQRTVEITTHQKNSPVMLGGMGMENMDMDLQGMLDKMMPKSSRK